MSQIFESHFSVEDYQLIEKNQLGTLLKVYRPSKRSVLLDCVFGFIGSFTLVSLSLLFLFTRSLPAWPGPLLPTLVGVFLLVMGGVLGVTTLPDARKSRLLIGETGMLQVTQVLGFTRVSPLSWKHILGIYKTPVFDEYRVVDRKGQAVVISAFLYPDGDQLLTSIRERIAGVERRAQTLIAQEYIQQDRVYWKEHGEWPDWLTEDERHRYEAHPE